MFRNGSLIIIIALSSILGGCGRDKYERAKVTPAGHHVVLIDQGGISGGLYTEAEVMQAFDDAYTAAAGRLGVPAYDLLRKERDLDWYWNLWDNCLLSHDQFPPPGVGSWIRPSDGHHADVCAYDVVASTDQTAIDPASPTWTRWTLYDYQVSGVVQPVVYVWGEPTLANPFPSLYAALGLLNGLQGR